MSIKLRLKYRYRSLRQFVESIRLPAWVWSNWTKGVVSVLIVISAVGYMFQINSVGTSGYALHTLEQRIASANDDMQKLNSELATAESLANVEERLKASGSDMAMVSTADIQYVRSLETTAFAR